MVCLYDTQKIGDPGENCRIIITRPFLSDKGSSIVPESPGNIIVSASRAGCYFGHVEFSGFAIGKCCGQEDCKMANATPIQVVPPKRRSVQERQVAGLHPHSDRGYRELVSESLEARQDPRYRVKPNPFRNPEGTPQTASVSTSQLLEVWIIAQRYAVHPCRAKWCNLYQDRTPAISWEVH